MKKINGCVAVSFKKRRVCLNKKEDKYSPYDRLRELKGKDDEESKTELAKVIQTIAENAEENFNKLKSELEAIKDDSGKLDAHKLWKLRKKMCPNNRDPPTAMLDKQGNLLTSDESITNRALEVYSERLANNKIKPHLEEFENDTNTLCEIRLKISKKKTTDPWSIEDLKLALKHLKKDKSRDPEGF